MSILFLRFQEAEDDCTEALNLDDRYIKAYSRRATARKELGKCKECIEGKQQPNWVWFLILTYGIRTLVYHCDLDLYDVMNIANRRC